MHEARQGAIRVDKDSMEEDFVSRAAAREQARADGKTRSILLVAVAAFLLGVGLTGYFAWRDDLSRWFSGSSEPEAASSRSVGEELVLAGEALRTPRANVATQAAQAVQAVQKVAQQQGGLEARVVAMEQRIDQLNLQAQAVSGNAARAEALLVAFASRRAIERGEPLGYLADQLRLRFGDARPNSVRIVIDGASQPITLDQLVARLDGLSTRLTVEPQDGIGWDRLRREVSELFVVRRETAPSPQPERRLARARQFLESGRVDAAIAEVRNMPGAPAARQWIADAERYAVIRRALDLLETTAILDSRDLRDGQGNRVRQMSPADRAGE